MPTPTISWSKDALPLREGSSGRTRITGQSGTTLHISSITRDDKGMYQCFAKNDYEVVQATAELRLGGLNIDLFIIIIIILLKHVNSLRRSLVFKIIKKGSL